MIINDNWLKKAKVNKNEYDKLYNESINDNSSFWSKQANRIDWIKKFSKTSEVTYSKDNVEISWFQDGELNVSYNCIDRHAEKNPNKIAIIWEGDDPSDVKKISYAELLKNVCKFANALKESGIKKGDRVTIYLTMIPELAYIMLACARIGAVHSIIFG